MIFKGKDVELSILTIGDCPSCCEEFDIEFGFLDKEDGTYYCSRECRDEWYPPYNYEGRG